jgi:tetratricopeptide (TPR) repeat protein
LPVWEPMGLGAITDIVQHAFGPVDLDRSPVELAAVAAVHRGCPACAGGRFGFPGELAESKASMCPTHLRQADSVINRRLARANASNPDGWAAIAAASLAIDRPHLPNGLAGRLPRADSSIYLIPEPDELAEHAAAVVEAAGWFRGRPDDFAMALGQEPESAGLWPEWLANLILDLGAADMGASAERVGDALGEIDPGGRATFDAAVSVAFAKSGLADEARDRIAANLTRWPHDLWVRVHAGDALVALGDPEGAAAHFEAALRMADESDDLEAASEVIDRLMKATRRSAGAHDGRGGQREQPKRKLRKEPRQRRVHRKRR